MTSLANVFAEKFKSAIETNSTLNKEGCHVPLQNISSPYVVIDMDKEGSPLASRKTRCDFLFISDNLDDPGVFSPLEFKKGALDAGKVVKQLQSGANLLDNHPNFSKNVNLVPVAVSGQHPKAQLSNLAKSNYQIRFNGKFVKISHMKCGQNLAGALGKYL